MKPERDNSVWLEQFAELFRTSPLPFALLRADYTIITCNQAFSKIFGLYPDEARGLDLAEKMHDFGKFYEFISELSLGKSAELEIGIRINKKTKRISLVGWRVLHEQQSAYAIVLKGAELVSSKRELKFLRHKLLEAEKKLDCTESLYKNVVDRTSDLVFTLDSNTTIKEISPQVERILGYKPSELVGLKFDAILSPKNYPEFEEAIENLKRSSNLKLSESSIDVKLSTKHGVSMDFVLHIMPIPYQASREPWFLVIAKCVFEPKLFEIDVSSPERLYYDLFEQSAEGIILLDQKGTILNCNRRAEEIFSCSKSEFIGKPISVLLDNDQISLLLKGWDALKNGERFTKPIEIVRTTKDGKRIPVEIHISGVYDSSGKLEVIQCAVRDISWRKQLEQQLAQTQKMESLGMMAGGIAHDFNNLLGGILGYATYAQSLMDKSHPAYKSVSTIIEAAKRASELTRQLLTFAKDGRLEQETVNINRLVRESVEMLKRSTTVPLKIHLNLDRALYNITASKAQVQQVLLNILFNARDAMPKGGIIKIVTKNYPRPRAHEEVPSLKEDVDYVKVSISDTGVGIPQDIINRIFEPFFTTKDKREYAGFGLSIVYSLMERHGGHVSVESEVGKGSTFHLYFPAAGERPIEEPSPLEYSEGKKQQVLVVDDEEMMTNLISDVLTSAGYSVLKSTSAKEALEVFQKKSDEIDLVIVDFVMPQMTGRELLDKMRKIKPNLKAIISSGYAPDSGKFSAADLREEVFVSKPFEVEQFLRVVYKTLEK